MTMAWVLTQFDTAVNLDFATHIWIEGGVGRDWNGVAILKVSEPGYREDEAGNRVLPQVHDLCIVLGPPEEAAPLVTKLLERAQMQSIVSIKDIVAELGFEFGYYMDHHP